MSDLWKEAWIKVILYSVGWMFFEIVLLCVTDCNVVIHGIAIIGAAMFLWSYSVVSYNRSKQLLCRVAELEQKLNLYDH